MEKSNSYFETVDKLSAWLQDKKNKDFSNKVMVVGIEGLCGSGKSTLSADLVFKVTNAGCESLIIEADLFHFGRDTVHKLYSNVIDAIHAGYLQKCDFHHLITWKTHQLQSQVLDKIKAFNASNDTDIEMVVENVLTNKTNGTEHNESFQISRKNIVFIPGTFLRYYNNLDFIIYLDIDPKISIERKQARTKNENILRSDELTQNIISMLEQPTFEALNKKIARKPDAVVNMNDFEAVSFKLS
ncbi:MAG: hypothetical protein ACD_72C00462G0005 [uncultured bacterium]|nr:MAG: hypothetical protein ACD_72C00462G0005 [uncultured bacterium]